MRPAIASIRLQHLIHNYRLLHLRAGSAEVMAVVKANAYGHDLALVAPALYADGCRSFAVTDADEGARLRPLIGNDAKITLLSGVFDAEDVALVLQHCLTPVVTETFHLQWLAAEGFDAEVWLKVDTGMQRLGASDPLTLLQQCRQSSIKVAGVMSHLACADEPEHPMNQTQLQAFKDVLQSLSEPLPASLLNSAGLVIMANETFDVVRPGLALYGIEPLVEQPMGLKPVMQLSAQVMQVRQVRRGVSISYGASYVAPRDMSVALVALGYGDGLPRALSNGGDAMYQGQRLSIVGRICMDYCLLDCTDTGLQQGEAVMFWGDTLPVTDVAQRMDTIPYTLTTGIQSRVFRRAIR